MIDYDNFHVLNYVKKEEYTGSIDGMRFMLKKRDTEDKKLLHVTIWPEPYSYGKTPDENKQTADFDFSEEGLQQTVAYLNEQLTVQADLWKLSKKM